MAPPSEAENRFESFGDDVDLGPFEQILDMDDDEYDREFSRSIVFGFIEQADQTFSKMDDALDNEDLQELSALGHFLKGSSATLGFTKIKDECEKIQHWGNKKDESGNADLTDVPTLLEKIGDSLQAAKLAFTTVEKKMNDFFSSDRGAD